MLVDARTIAGDSALDFDLCIVGGGGAGITLALELAGSGLKVCCLEAGGLEYESETQSLYEGETSGRPYPDLDFSRLRFLGGSTNHWGGNCSPLDPIDFESRPWIAHSGWPISRSDLDPYYERAQTYCRLGPFRFDAAYWAERRESAPLDLGPDIVTEVAMGSPANFGLDYRDALDAAQDVTVFLHANVTDLVPSDDGGALSMVEVRVLDGGTFSVTARRFVIATGGIENARLLLHAVEVAERPLAVNRDLIGRFFMDHPLVEGAGLSPSHDLGHYDFYRSEHFGDYNVMGYFKLSEERLRQEQTTNLRMPLGERTRYYTSEGIASYHGLTRYSRPEDVAGLLWHHVGNVVTDLDMVVEAVSRKARGRRIFPYASDFHYYGLDSMIEQTPDPENRVYLLDERDTFGMRRAGVRMRLSEQDRANVWRCYEILAQAVGQAGQGRLRLLRNREWELWGRSLSWGHHHMGTTRMHEDPKQGVVDADGRVHGLSNLYIAGSSVFPTGGCVPPTLTIVALAVRMADHLKHVATGGAP